MTLMLRETLGFCRINIPNIDYLVLSLNYFLCLSTTDILNSLFFKMFTLNLDIHSPIDALKS